mmetsp:Transcript_27614/g.58368  ORF Transcript_27614/g.58368 Transcript_27614/m.58368 type:complete len:532 (+) Transcript_27614:507-2102(+)|eukprot:CAMPEP_0183748386 /NCGR_PEP_ID=MMETSP0737-20130205/67742_1 /TAXON_ID=385413 /ORGANISM="Thalassiosira miniscula, Strain CCMP1093" /LENGTH=531 /DNA_ID=CAMNT_0025984109 /DNA_START=1549 /DNA_END=3144 /DNA_ORIENTATION=-
MKTESLSKSPSPAPSSSSPTTHDSTASPPPHEGRPILNQLQVALKVLVSNSASGLIIGRSGSTISELQAKSQTRIKLSQGGDYYPGTSDRVCLIQGTQANASLAVEMVLSKLYELQSFQQLSSSPPSTRRLSDSGSSPDERAPTSFIVRILVPSTCCGMIIGRGGSNIKSLKEKSEVTYIQLSPKEHMVMIGGSTLSTSERIMTITGPNFTSCVNCVKIILDDMAQNPEISRYINMTTSYSKNLASTTPSSYTMAPTTGFFMEHESFQQHLISQTQMLESSSRYGMSDQFIPGQFGPSPAPGMGLQPDQNILGLLPQQLLRHQGSPSAYDAVTHGDMSMPLLGDPPNMIPSQAYGQSIVSTPPRNPEPGVTPASFPPYPQSQPFWSSDVSAGSPGRNILPSASGDLSTSVDRLSQSFTSQASIQRHHSNPSLQHLAGSKPVSVQLGVPDTRIGSILGRGGKTLTELQNLSHTKIRISQRGEFIPGTQNRIVSITGNTTQDVENAQNLVNQCLTSSFSRSSSSPELPQLKDE